MSTAYNIFTTTQRHPASRLAQIIEHHQETIYRKPIAHHQKQTFEIIKKNIERDPKPLILDSGCGTGMSTILLAKAHPDHWVLGLDKSLARLSRQKQTLENALLIRADLIDMWRLLALERWPITKHYIFFPNPWPKASQLKRRFHAHPVFSLMTTLAPLLELRTNWLIYAQEFALALEILGHRVGIQEKVDNHAMSLFEKKYLESGCPIYIVKSQCLLPDTNY